jgi:hypothetical protein
MKVFIISLGLAASIVYFMGTVVENAENTFSEIHKKQIRRLR